MDGVRGEAGNVTAMVETTISRIEAGEGDLAAEVRGLADLLSRSMTELKAIGAHSIGADAIPTANSELDAIVQVTETATGSILDAVEIVETVAGDIEDSDAATTLTAAATNIYQACNFQDLTGQRVRKVVDTLGDIEARVAAICEAFGLDGPAAESADTAEGEPDPDDDSWLLNGPALPEEAMSQADIDKMLADFD